MNRGNILLLVVALLVCAIVATNSSADDEIVTTARQVMSEHGKAVIKVHAVTQTATQGFGIDLGMNDQGTQVTGIVIDESGLAIVPFSSLDPNTFVKVITFNVGGEEQKIEQKTKFKRFDYVLGDGTRIPAKIVLTDKKLDVAVVAPEKQLDEATSDKLSNISIDDEVQAELLDRVVSLGRLNASLNSQLSVGLGRISSIVTKPRTMYVGAAAKPGQPVFTKDGEFLGMGVMRMPNTQSIGAAMQAELVVVPSVYLNEVITQAKAKLAEEETE